MIFTPIEREKMGVLVNNLSFFGSQILSQGAPEFSLRALSNLRKVKGEHEDLLKRLDELARQQGDESPLRLIEDLVRLPTDVAQMLTLVRRCLLASSFIGHCIAQPSDQPTALEALTEEKRLH
jgi:hypothetical protein